MLINGTSIRLTFILEIIYERSFKTEAVLVTIKHIFSNIDEIVRKFIHLLIIWVTNLYVIQGTLYKY